MKNTMKKLMLTAVAVVMMFMLTACGGGEYYRLESYSLSPDNVTTVEADSRYAKVNYIEFTSAKEGVLCFNGEESPFTVENGQMIVGNTHYTYTIEGDKLSLDRKGYPYVFVKDTKPAPDKTYEEMVGLYVLEQISNDKTTVDKTAIERSGYSNYYITVRNDYMANLEFDGGIIYAEVIDGELRTDDRAYPYTFENGKLTVEMLDHKYTFAPGERNPYLIPQGYYKTAKMTYKDAEFPLDLIDMGLDLNNFTIEVGSDGMAYMTDGTVGGLYHIEDNTLVLGREKYPVLYAGQLVILELAEELKLYMPREEKPRCDFTPGSYPMVIVSENTTQYTEDDISAKGLGDAELRIAEDGTVSFYVKGSERVAEEFGDSYYIDGKNILLSEARGYKLCCIDGLMYTFK